MTVFGYNLSSISAERKEVKKIEKLDVNSAPKIVSVEERTIDVGIKQDTLAIGFEFSTMYSPNIGHIKLKGEVLYVSKDNKKVLKDWKKDKRLPQDVDIEVKNFLFKRCLLLGIDLSDSLQLPLPIVFPTIVPEEGKQTKG